MAGQVGDTITPTNGYSVQSQQMADMADTLSKIKGVSPQAAAYLGAAQAGPNYQGTDIPQNMSKEDLLQTMFAYDQSFAQKYGNQNVFGPTAAGTTPNTNLGGPAFSSAPETSLADAQSNGMLTPGGISGMTGGTEQSQSDTMKNILNAINFSGTRSDTAYTSMLGALKDIYDQSQSSSNKQVVQEADGTYLVDTLTGQQTKLGNPASTWQLKKSTLLPATRGLSALGISTGIGAQDAQYQTSLYNTKTGQELVPDKDGYIKVKVLASGRTGKIKIENFDSTVYDPIPQ